MLHLWAHHAQAIRLQRMFIVVVLMVVFGFIKIGERRNLCHDGWFEFAALVEAVSYVFSHFELSRRVIKYSWPIIIAYIIAFSIELGGVMKTPKYLQYLSIADDWGVEYQLDAFRMTCLLSADLRICGVEYRAAAVPNR